MDSFHKIASRVGAWTWIGVLLLAGCMTPERAMQETERIGNRLAADYRRQVTGQTNAFSIARPSDRLRLRLQLEQGLENGLATPRSVLPDPLVLSLTDALMAGARNNNGYQASKESVFSAALDLQLQQHAFENTFAGALGLGFSRDAAEEGSDGTTRSGKLTALGKPSVTRRLANGATISASLGLDVIRLLTGDRGTTLGLLGDATIKMPLLRGTGRLINLEPLTQAERNLVYAIYTFESFRQTYAVQVASGYYSMLEVSQRVQALKDNQRRLSDNYRRAELLFDAGRLSQVELDQTRQDLLRTGDQLVTAEQSRQTQLDAFKMTLGLPVDARIEIDMRGLDQLQTAMGVDPGVTNGMAPPSPPKLPFTEGEALDLVLTNRHDLILARYRLEDAERALKIAADRLRPDLELGGSANVGQMRRGGDKTGDSSGYSLTLDGGLPWERTAERNAYRAAHLAVDSARRAVEMAEDSAKNAVRTGMRGIQAAWSSYVIQAEALRVALRRVRSTDLFQQAGRASTRDVLEAESALLSAQNALVSAMVNYRMAGLELRRDLSALELSEEGTWREFDDAENP